MKNRKLLIGVVLVVAILLLGIGYAAITGTTLTISGNVVASPDATNFKVKFAETPAPTATATRGSATAGRTDDQNATLEISGLTAANDKAIATYTIVNESPDLSANLVIDTEAIVDVAGETLKATDYFTIDAVLADDSLVKGGTTTVTVTVTLNKTPVDADVKGTINVKLSATPEQP